MCLELREEAHAVFTLVIQAPRRPRLKGGPVKLTSEPPLSLALAKFDLTLCIQQIIQALQVLHRVPLLWTRSGKTRESNSSGVFSRSKDYGIARYSLFGKKHTFVRADPSTSLTDRYFSSSVTLSRRKEHLSLPGPLSTSMPR